MTDSPRPLSTRRHTVLAWTAPIAVGFMLAYLATVVSRTAVGVALGVGLAAAAAAYTVMDWRLVRARRRWAQILTDQRNAVLGLHRPWISTEHGRRYQAVLAHPGPEHECIAEPIWIQSLGQMKCLPELGVHVVLVCDACREPWPCRTAAVVEPAGDLDVDVVTLAASEGIEISEVWVDELADAGSADPWTLLVLGAFLAELALAGSVALDVDATGMDGRGVLALAIAVAVGLAFRARGRLRRAEP